MLVVHNGNYIAAARFVIVRAVVSLVATSFAKEMRGPELDA
jgi:hypothetical protein